MLESSREVTAGVVVKGEVRVAIGCLRVVTAQDSLLENDRLSLEVDGLEEIAKFKLD